MFNDQQRLGNEGASTPGAAPRDAFVEPVQAREPARAVLAAAASAWAGEDAERVLWLLERMGPTTLKERAEAAVLRAHAFLQGSHPERVLELLDPADGEPPAIEQAAAQTLRGRALVALGRLEEGTAVLRSAAACTDPPHGEALCELVAALLTAGQLHDAESLLAPLLDAPSEPEPVIAARALQLYGRIESARGRRPAAARYCLDALAVLDRVGARSPSLRATLASEVASIAVSTLEPRLLMRVRHQLTAASAAPGRGVSQRVEILGELLAGEIERAWRLAYDTLQAAPSGIASVAARVDAALVSHAAGERFTPAQLVLRAVEMAQDLDLSGAHREHEETLLRLVAALAPVDVARAAAFLRALDAAPGTSESSTNEHPAHALARASLARAMGRPSEERSALCDALGAARAFGSQYAEAEALLALAALDAEPDLLQQADALTAVVPRSWLRRHYESLAAQARGPARLSGAERRVMHAICEGLTTAEIAARFGRSSNTIRNQTRRVYQVLDVRSRSHLVMKCAALGLLGQEQAPVAD